MSATARYIGSSLRTASSTHSSSLVSCARTVTGARAYGQAAVQQRPQPSNNYRASPPRTTRDWKRTPSRGSPYYPPQLRDTEATDSQSSTQEPSRETLTRETRVPGHFAEYLNRLFAPLEFPPELAQQVLTHNSHVLARRGHNAALSFIGRRVLSAYLHIFLQTCPTLTPSHDIEQITANTLNSNLLGEHVGHEWGIGRVLIWQPAAPSHKLSDERSTMKALHAAGLYKVSGEAVQAMIGAIYNQFGGAVALKVFHAQLLPLLRVKGGLPREFHEHAMKTSLEHGGTWSIEQPVEKLEEETTSKVEASSH